MILSEVWHVDVKNVNINTIISPHIHYCESLLLMPSTENIHRLQLRQNKCMRVMLMCNIDWVVNEGISAAVKVQSLASAEAEVDKSRKNINC